MFGKILFLIFAFLVLLNPSTFADEQITITTYYPSPYGSYREIAAHRMKLGTTYSGSAVSVADNNLLVEGRVGIGTTSPQDKLHIYDPADSAIRLQRSGSSAYAEWRYVTGTSFLGTVEHDAFVLMTNNADRIHIHEDGNVGIGIANPGIKLEVNGPIRASGTGGNVLHNCRMLDASFSGTEASISCAAGEIVVGGGGGCDSGALRNTRPSSLSTWEITCEASGSANRIRAICCQI